MTHFSQKPRVFKEKDCLIFKYTNKNTCKIHMLTNNDFENIVELYSGTLSLDLRLILKN